MNTLIDRLPNRIRDFLADWLLDHILAEDMLIGQAIRNHNSTRV